MRHPYLSLDYVARLSFRDIHGLDAMFECYQRLLVLAPTLTRISHRIWGPGDQLNYYYSPSAELLQLVDSDGGKLLLSALNAPAHRGQEIEIHSIRRIHHAFKASNCYWEYVPLSPTERARVTIRFPLGRDAERISVGATSGSATPHVRRPGTKELQLSVPNPTLGATYRTEWSW